MNNWYVIKIQRKPHFCETVGPRAENVLPHVLFSRQTKHLGTGNIKRYSSFTFKSFIYYIILLCKRVKKILPAASHFFCAGSLLYSWNTIDTKATHNNQVKMIRISLPAAPLTSTVPCSLSWRSHCDSDSRDNYLISIINTQQQKKKQNY